MNQKERREYLIRALLEEDRQYQNIRMPEDEKAQRELLRALMNVRPPRSAHETFLNVQNEYLRQRAEEKGIVRLEDLTPIQEEIYLWQGDITCLEADAIVNAANAGMTGCYQPNHNCIDNCIHTFAGVQLRQECARQMEEQGHAEETGKARITPAWNLPAKFILHTVGPIISGPVTKEDEALLASCYRSCLELAEKHGLKSVAFCCISTGVFRFPNRRAAQIAVETVKAFKKERNRAIKVIFNVFKDEDRNIYEELLAPEG